MEPESVPSRASRVRRWPQVLIALAVVGVVIAAVVFVVNSEEATSSTGDPAPTTTAPLRPCVQAPEGTTANGPAEPPPTPPDPAADPAATSTTTPVVDHPPDGTYLASLAPVSGSTEVTLIVLATGGRTYTEVPLAPGIAVPVSPIGGAVTVDAGTITAVDTGRVSWDDDLGRGDDPCRPRTGCVMNDEPVAHAWPGGIDGLLGDDIRKVPDALSTALAKWGVEVDPLAITLVARPCVLGVMLGEVALRLTVELTDDGYVLSHVTSDRPDDTEATLSYSAEGDTISLPLSPVFAQRYPEAIVSATVRVGDRSEKASTTPDAASLDVSIDRRPTQRASVVFTYRDPDGGLRRMVAFQIPPGDSAAS